MRAPLLEGLLDDASALPPASEPVAAVRSRHDQLRAGAMGHAVGRLLVLASQLDDPSLTDLPADRLGAVADRHPTRAVAHLQRRVPAAGTSAAIAELRDHAPVLYLEATDPTDRSHLEPIATARAVGIDARAAVRLVASGRPSVSVADLAGFVQGCVTRGLPFRIATTALPAVRRGEEEGTGVLNVLAATRCVLAGDLEAATGALHASDPALFDREAATFRDVGRDVDDTEVRATLRAISVTDLGRALDHLEQLT